MEQPPIGVSKYSEVPGRNRRYYSGSVIVPLSAQLVYCNSPYIFDKRVEFWIAFQEVLAKGYFYNEIMTRKVLSSLQSIVDDSSQTNSLINLTAREQEFIKYACSEMTYQEIADQMCLSERTIDGYRENLFKKLNVGSRVGLVLYAVKNKLVEI